MKASVMKFTLAFTLQLLLSVSCNIKDEPQALADYKPETIRTEIAIQSDLSYNRFSVTELSVTDCYFIKNTDANYSIAIINYDPSIDAPYRQKMLADEIKVNIDLYCADAPIARGVYWCSKKSAKSLSATIYNSHGSIDLHDHESGKVEITYFDGRILQGRIDIDDGMTSIKGIFSTRS
ncbi:hypothetical protein K1X84_01940 [bacterium]|nr:hypothetical protein [bacterium]